MYKKHQYLSKNKNLRAYHTRYNTPACINRARLLVKHSNIRPPLPQNSSSTSSSNRSRLTSQWNSPPPPQENASKTSHLSTLRTFPSIQSPSFRSSSLRVIWRGHLLSAIFRVGYKSSLSSHHPQKAKKKSQRTFYRNMRPLKFTKGKVQHGRLIADLVAQVASLTAFLPFSFMMSEIFFLRKNFFVYFSRLGSRQARKTQHGGKVGALLIVGIAVR